MAPSPTPPETELWHGDRKAAQIRFLSFAQLLAERMPPAWLNRMSATMALYCDRYALEHHEPGGFTERLTAELKACWIERLSKQNPN
jgi:hypothetical protein